MTQSKKLSETREAEILMNVGRYDLRPVESPNTGYSVEHHDRATIAANRSNSLDLDLPVSRPVTDPTNR